MLATISIVLGHYVMYGIHMKILCPYLADIISPLDVRDEKRDLAQQP